MIVDEPDRVARRRRSGRGAVTTLGAAALTCVFFLVLPLMQAMSKPPATDLEVRDLDVAELPPPPPPPPQEEQKQEQHDDKPPELAEESPPLDLSQLELALNPGMSGSWMTGDFGVKLDKITAGHDDVDALFSEADLDQKPRVIYQPAPAIDASVRRKAPGKVNVLFTVDERGRVENPIVHSSSDPIFERPALAAVKQWRFEPGKRKGQSVRFRMRVPITFPKG